MLEKNFKEYMTSFESHRDELNTKIASLESQLEERDNKIERLKTTLVAGAEFIKENWDKLCDEDGYGPQNLLLRMDGTLNSSGYSGYSAGEFDRINKELSEAKKEIDSQNQAILAHVSDKDSLRARIEELSNDIEVLNTNLKESQERWLIAVHKGFEKKEELREALKETHEECLQSGWLEQGESKIKLLDKCRKLIGE
jgi:chromosome segregation ATPase